MTDQLIEIAKECGSYVVDEGVDWTAYMFGEDELQQFAQRIEQPLRDEIEQLREALLQCKGFVDAYGQPETKEIVRKALEGK